MSSHNGWSEPPHSGPYGDPAPYHEPNPFGDPYRPPAGSPYVNPYDGSVGGGFPQYGVPAWRQPADRLARLAAVLVDGCLGIIVGIPGIVLLFSGVFIGAAQKNGDEMAVLGALVGYACIVFSALGLAVYQWVLLSQQGQTVGKRLLNVRIVNYNDGGNPGFVKAVLLRQWVMALLTGVPCVGAIIGLVDIFMIFGEEGRCLHDQLSETIVIPAHVQPPQQSWQSPVPPPVEYI